MLDAALRQCRAWRARGLDIRFSVNISTRTLLDHDLPATIRTLLDRYEVPPGSLQLEITESRFVADLGRARTVLHELRAMGVTIAIDDFGTGFSSLAQLQQLPVDEIKIDRSFVMRMETDHDDAVLVRSIIELGHNLGLHVTAEGVETPATNHLLREMGCDFAQGYYLGRPVPANECRRLLGTITSPGREGAGAACQPLHGAGVGMKRSSLGCALAAVACAVSFASAAPAHATTTTSPYVVVLKQGVGDIDGETSALAAQDRFSTTFRYAKALKGFAARLTSTQVQRLSTLGSG